MFEVFRKVFAFLTPEERKRACWLALAIVIAALFDLIGVVSIFPFLSIASDPSKIQTNSTLKWIYTTMDFTNKNNFLFALGVAALGILVIGNGFRAFTTWTIYYFTMMKRYDVSKKLFRHYLHEPYMFFLNRNSSELTAHLLQNVNSAVSGVFVPGMQLIANVIVTLFIILLLFMVDPLVVLLAAVVVSGAYGIVYLLVRRKLTVIGKELVIDGNMLYKILGEAFGGIKVLKLMGKEDVFLDRYSETTKKFMHSDAVSQTISLLPKYILETIAFGGIMTVMLYLIAAKEDFNKAIPLIGLYAFAGYRLIPSLQAIFYCITQIQRSSEALEVVYRDFVSTMKEDHHAKIKGVGSLPFFKKLELRNLIFKYLGAQDAAIKNLSLIIHANTTVGFVGATGSGKTTTVDIILGLLVPQQGEIIVDDIIINSKNLHLWQPNIGYVPQYIYLCDDTITRNIAFGVPDHEIDHKAVEHAARLANIHDFILNELPDRYETLVGERGVRLSGGQIQRLGIARALYYDPSVIILDEATSSLDTVTENIVMDAIHGLAHKKTIIIIAHRLSTVKECDMIYLFKHGKIVEQGNYQSLRRTSQYFDEMARAYTM